MRQDVIDIEVLADGTVKLTTSAVSGPNHMSAEALMRSTLSAIGGTVKRTRRVDINATLHHHDHDHDHDHHHDHHHH